MKKYIQYVFKETRVEDCKIIEISFHYIQRKQKSSAQDEVWKRCIQV